MYPVRIQIVTSNLKAASYGIETKHINTITMEGIFVPLGAFAMVVAIVYLRQRKSERLLMIEKGVDPKIFESPKLSAVNLKWGILLVGLGIGLMIANALSRTIFFRKEEAYFAMLFLFGGISLLLFHFIDWKKRKNIE